MCPLPRLSELGLPLHILQLHPRTLLPLPLAPDFLLQLCVSGLELLLWAGFSVGFGRCGWIDGWVGVCMQGEFSRAGLGGPVLTMVLLRFDISALSDGECPAAVVEGAFSSGGSCWLDAFSSRSGGDGMDVF